MEGNLTERRSSTAFVPLWLDTNTTGSLGQEVSSTSRELSPRPENEEGLPPNKVQIQNADAPRIQVQRHHRGPNDSHYENTEVEELIAMLRETENLEEQGDILQYLVDTQGLDFNTGEYLIFLKLLSFSFNRHFCNLAIIFYIMIYFLIIDYFAF